MVEQRHATRARRILWEYLIIVIGVLTALAVDNWNANRLDRGLERYYLEGIVADLDSVTSVINQATSQSSRTGEAALLLLDWIEGTSGPEDMGELGSAIRRVTSGTPTPAESPAWVEMNERGHVQLIRSDDLRQLLIRDMGSLNRLRGLMLQTRDFGSTRIRTSGIYRALPPEYWAETRELEPGDLPRALSRLRGNQEIRNGLEDLIVNENRRRTFLRRFEADAATLRSVIAGTLGP